MCGIYYLLQRVNKWLIKFSFNWKYNRVLFLSYSFVKTGISPYLFSINECTQA